MSLLGREYRSIPVVVPDDARDLVGVASTQPLPAPLVSARPNGHGPERGVHREHGTDD